MARALMAALAAPFFWLYALFSAGVLAGVVLLLFLRRRLGFYLFCGVSLLGLVFNIAASGDIVGAVLETGLGLLVTYMLLRGELGEPFLTFKRGRKRFLA